MKSAQRLSLYSPETVQIIEKYMKAANLTTLQRATILRDLEKGKSLPISLLRYEIPCSHPVYKRPTFLSKKNKKRKLETIVNSGAYDVPKFIPLPLTDREKEKEKFQNILSGIYEILEQNGEEPNTPIKTRKTISRHERIEELTNEIEERIQFLNEMEKLGVKHKYDFEIKNEIAKKLKQLQDLSNDASENIC